MVKFIFSMLSVYIHKTIIVNKKINYSGKTFKTGYLISHTNCSKAGYKSLACCVQQ